MKSNESISLCFVLPTLGPFFLDKSSAVGGAEANFYYLSQALAKDSQYQVSALIGDYGQQAVIHAPENVTLHRIRYFTLFSYKNILLKQLNRLVRRISFILSLVRTRADIMIFSTASELLFYGVLIKFLKGYKVIYRVSHDLNCSSHHAKSKNISGFLFRLGLRLSDRIVAQTSFQQQALNTNYSLDSVLIKNGFPIKLPEASLKRSFYLWVARLKSWKQPEMFLELAKNNPKISFMMIASGSLDSVNMLKKDVENIPNLSLKTNVKQFEVLDYFRKARCLVNTSLYEGYPNTFLQAGLTQTPILSLHVNPDNMFDNYFLGCYCNGHLDHANHFIKTQSQASLDEMGKESYLYVREHHDILNSMSKYEQLFKQLFHKIL